MSGLSNQLGKSTVNIGEKEVTKRYIDPEKRPPKKDPILSLKSSTYPPIYYFRKETNMLRVLSQIPDERRLSPKLLDDTNETFLEVVMERIQGETFRDLALAAHKSGGDVIGAMKDVPKYVAAIHHQLLSYQNKLIEEVRWGDPKSPTQGLKVRTTDEEKGRTWHYLRAIVYSLSPDLEELREGRVISKTKSGKRITGISSAIARYLGEKGVVAKQFTENFVKNDFKIMYDVDRIPPLNSASPIDVRNYEAELLSRGKIFVVHGDLGPQHLFSNGHYIDLDEARLAAHEVDLVSALYNTYTSPLDSDDKELRMIEYSLEYLREMLKPEGKEPTAEDKAAFLTRVVEARLKEGLRLFAADCKAPVKLLRELTDGHPYYASAKDEELRQMLLQRTFVDGLQRFLHFYTSGAGYRALTSTEKSHLVYDQLSSVQDALTKTRVFEGLGNPDIVGRLERLIGSNPPKA